MNNPPPPRWKQLVEEKQKREAAAAAAAVASTPSFDPALIPEQTLTLTPEQEAADAFIDNIDIVDAYNKFGGPTKNPRVLPGQRESIKARCPNPGHVDKNPTYWMNRDKGTGNCGVCGGIDTKDIAAYYFGYPVPEYKKNGDFPKLMRQIGEAYGFHYERSLGGETVVWREPEDNSDEPDTPGNSDTPDNSDISDISETQDEISAETQPENTDSAISAVPDNVESLFGDEELEIVLPTFDWREIAPGTDTFIDRYMEACRKDESPEEYHFFNALIAVAFTAGRTVGLKARRTVYGNLFICHLGKTGSGKSSAEEHLRVLLKRVHPYKHDDPANLGVDTVTPASGESLIKAFSKPVYDPINPKIVAFHAPVKGLVIYNELASLVGRASKTGNIIKPTLMDFYDMRAEVKTQSNTGGKIIAEHPFACSTTTSQPKALRDLLGRGDDESGFLNRWVFVGGTRKESTIMGQGPVNLDGPTESLEELKGWCGSFTGGGLVDWEPGAIDRMQRFIKLSVQPLKDDPDTDIFTRLDLLMLKLALLLTVNKKERFVTEETVSTVMRLFPYIHASYGVIAGQLGSTLENDITNAIIYQMKRIGGKDGASLNAIAKALKRRNYPKELILRNIKSLIELGYVEERAANAGTRGRPTKKYAYVA